MADAPSLGRDRPQRSLIGRAAVIALVFAAVAWVALIWPYARALWWLYTDRAAPQSLVVPVAGVPAEKLEANFGAPRDGGRRRHEGIDIMAPAGTPVLATAPGIIVGNRRTPIGGVVLWILGSGGRLYYYAHMRELAAGMSMGRHIAAGSQIGTVGNTGNAMRTPPHLHFGIYQVTSLFFPMRYHAIDPYPLLLR